MLWILTIPIAATITAAGYAVACLVAPDVPCPRCRGRGVRRLPIGRTEVDCRTCRGRGHRLRWGVRWWASVRTGGRVDDLPDWID